MFTPKTPYDDKENVLPDWHEPFPEPQTIPSGWDLSEVLSSSTTVAIDDAELCPLG
jgi:hypothetical protein